MKATAVVDLKMRRAGRKLLALFNSIVSKVFASYKAVGLYLLVATLATIITSRLSGSFLSFWAPKDDALSVAWQVHASFIAIGFAGLAIAFQLLSDPPLAAGPARRTIVNRLQFTRIVLFSIGADVVAGLAAIWFRSHSSVILVFFAVMLPSMAAIGYLYFQTAKIFSNPRMIEQWTFDDLMVASKKISLELAEVRSSNNVLYERINGLPGLSTDSQPSEQEPICEVLARETGVVKSVKLSLLGEISGLVSKLETAIDKSDSHEASPIPESAKVNVEFLPRVGTELTSASLVARIYGAGSLSQSVLKSVTEILNECLVIRMQRDEYGGLHLQKEMEDLQDNLILAIKGGKYSTGKRGYEYYRGIASAIRQQISGVTPAGSQITDTGEWDWLSRQIWEVNNVAIDAGMRFGVMATGAALMRCVDSVTDRDLGSLRSSLMSYEQLWVGSIGDGKSADMAVNILVSLQNLTEFAIPAKGAPIEFIRATLDTWTTLCKNAFDLDDEEIFGKTLNFHRSLFKFSDVALIRNEVRLGQLVLLGWLLLSRTKSDDAKNIKVEDLLDATYGGSVFGALRLATQREPYGRWTWWEADWSQPMEASFVQLPDYIDRAALILMCRNGIGEILDVTSDSYHQAFRLLQKFDLVKQDWSPNYGPVERLDAIETALTKVVNDWNFQRSEQLWAADLAPDKIAKFISSLDVELSNVVSILPLFEAEADSEFTHEVVRVLGGRFFVPKEFFAPVDDHVFADTEMLAQQLARSMSSGEDTIVVDHISKYGVAEDVELDGLIVRIAAWLTTAVEPLVIVLGSHAIASSLGHFDNSDPAGLGEYGAPLKLVYIDGSRFSVLLVDRKTVPKIRRWPESKNGMNPIGQHSVSASVSLVAKDDKHKEPVCIVEVGTSYCWESKEEASIVLLQVTDAEY
ncbi:hypothetical protein [Amycolatopsis sp. NPDC059657]|uniref:hypothetical protein n=1 Tax=Amycolatopsis sp. NPDC059657 TaxID=3346899 RepID=UPI00366D59C7